MLTDAVGRASDLLGESRNRYCWAEFHLRAYGAIDAFRELAQALSYAVVMPNAPGFLP